LNKLGNGSAHYIVANVGVSLIFYIAKSLTHTLIVQSKAGCDALITEFKKRESKLHVLINNSGISWGGPYDNFPEEKGWDNVFAVNVKSIFYSMLTLPFPLYHN
jgi:NAD(P)-dependent dehydrogenase (short-subunit alcohol dehydrogenase family)